MKTQARTANPANTIKLRTLPSFVSRKIRKTVATTKFVAQFVVVDKLLAVPMTCRGYISVFTVHGVEDIPTLKLPRNKIMPANAT